MTVRPRRVLLVILLRVVGMLSFLSANWLFAYFAGAGSYGLVAFAIAQTAFLGMMMHLGIGSVLINELVADRHSPVVGTVFTIRLLLLPVAVAIIVLIAFLQRSNSELFPCVLLLGASNLVMHCDLQPYFDANGRIPLHAGTVCAQQVVFLIGVGAFALLSESVLTPVVFSLLMVGTHVLKLSLQLALYGVEIWRALGKVRPAMILGFVGRYWMMPATAVTIQFALSIHVILLPMFTSLEETGKFALAYRVVVSGGQLLSIPARIVYPQLARLMAESGYPAFAKAFRDALRRLFLYGIVVVPLIAALASLLVPYLVTKDYLGLEVLFPILMVVILFNIPGGISTNSLVVTGQFRSLLGLAISSLAIGTLLDVLLMPILGIYGAVMSCIVQAAALCFSSAFFVLRRT